MTAPDFSQGFLRIPHRVWLDLYCRTPVTRRQLQLVSVVLRESWGWQATDGQVHLWTRPLSTRQFAGITGLAVDHLRTDLDHLVERGFLRRRGDRFQLVADAHLWITPARPPRLWRSLPLEWSESGAEGALPNLASKKEKRKKRNVAPSPESDIEAPVENSRSSRRVVSEPFGAAEISATAAARLADIVAAFVGSLSPSQAEALRLWIYEEGVAAVWAALEPSFRQGAVVARHRLEQILADREKRWR